MAGKNNTLSRSVIGITNEVKAVDSIISILTSRLLPDHETEFLLWDHNMITKRAYEPPAFRITADSESCILATYFLNLSGELPIMMEKYDTPAGEDAVVQQILHNVNDVEWHGMRPVFHKRHCYITFRGKPQ